MPKTKFSAIQNPIYNKENVKSKKKELWPNNVQKAFEEAYIMYSWMNDRETKLIAGKHYGRNELIGLYIKEKTNEIRDRKQVSSHIQGLLPKVSSSTMNTIKNQSLLMTNACANFIFNQPVKFHAGQIPDYVKIDNVLNMVSESSTQQVLLQTKIFFKTKEIRNEENIFWVDKINKKGNYSLSFSPKFMNSLIKEAKSKPKDKIDVFFQKLVIIQTFTDPISKTLLLNVVYQFESGYGAGDDSTSQIFLIMPNEEVKYYEYKYRKYVMNTNSNIANPNIIMTEKCELLQNALTTTASTFLDSNFNNLFGSCGGGVESQLYQTSSFLPPKSNDRYLQLYAAGNIITGNGNDLSSESDDMIIEKYMNCNDFSNGSKEIETIRSEFDSIIAEVMKET
ncbi:7753_t:CDS:10 [Entrophospora sp. SA101]|nr:7753_t:CDS:10 [Entrophospora sp. SA101]